MVSSSLHLTRIFLPSRSFRMTSIMVLRGACCGKEGGREGGGQEGFEVRHWVLGARHPPARRVVCCWHQHTTRTRRHRGMWWPCTGYGGPQERA